MSARDDYPELAWWCNPDLTATDTGREASKALDEIDLLRAALATHNPAKYGPASRSQTERRP